MRSLPLFHRISGQPVIVLGEGEAADAKRRLVERAGGIVITEIEGIEPAARIAFVAHDEPARIEADVARLREAGVLVNAPDHPDLCDFTVPSLLDRDPVLIAIGTSGASAGLAKAIRLRLETLLPQRLGALANALHSARSALRARWPDAGERRLALDAALAEGGALDPLRDQSADAVSEWLEDTPPGMETELIEIDLTSDDPEDLTLRQARLLGSADVILHTAGVAPAILARARADAVRHCVSNEGVHASGREGLVILLRRR